MLAPRVDGFSIGIVGLTALLAIGFPPTAATFVPRAYLAVSPTTVGAPGDVASESATCSFSASAWHCALTLSESAKSTQGAGWTASSSGHARFTPSEGTLRPGTTTRISVVITSCGGDYALNFTGPQNIARATFACG